MQNTIETKGLTKFYGKARGIIDLNLEINQGEIFGFIGPNGAGKSTAIRTLLGFIHPTTGQARIFGRDCFKESALIKREIGYLPAEVSYYDDMRVRDLLSYSASFYHKDCRERSEELCSLFELEPYRKIESLSFGNRKKVAIIQALQHQPQLLILDEPTGGLDPLMQNRFFEVLRAANQQGATIFLSSHVLSEVQKFCHRVAIIKEGRIIRVDRVETLRAAKFRKIKIEFKNEADAKLFNLRQGITELDREGRFMEFLYGGEVDAFIRQLAERQTENLWIEEPSLEEVFMHYYQPEGH